ncbi:hypothetical protein, partial [Mesorhizobium sp.]|uniref:hypothetical protein n=1 Tax=Mesorhizobium sp. TaxID=1871066 RepID=UPI000FE65C48
MKSVLVAITLVLIGFSEPALADFWKLAPTVDLPVRAAPAIPATPSLAIKAIEEAKEAAEAANVECVMCDPVSPSDVMGPILATPGVSKEFSIVSTTGNCSPVIPTGTVKAFDEANEAGEAANVMCATAGSVNPADAMDTVQTGNGRSNAIRPELGKSSVSHDIFGRNSQLMLVLGETSPPTWATVPLDPMSRMRPRGGLAAKGVVSGASGSQSNALIPPV